MTPEHEQQYLLENDYRSWAAQRRIKGLSEKSEIFRALRAAALAAQKHRNDSARFNRLRAEQDQAKTKALEKERAIDERLEPHKQRLKRDWLVSNPTFTERDFDEKAWQHLRANLLEEEQQNMAQAALREAGQASVMHKDALGSFSTNRYTL